MFRRRGRKDEDAATPAGPADGSGAGDSRADDSRADEAGAVEAAADAGGTDTGPVAAADSDEAPKSERPHGPYDVSEVDLTDEENATRVDLGGLLIRGAEGMALQLQVEEGSERVQAALVILDDSAVQLLAVAAPRSSGMWPETMAEMVQDAQARGASVERAEGPFGDELRVLLPVELPDGEEGVQPSRVVGIDGPRWLLRATFLGRATLEDDAFDRLAQVVRDVVVVRGDTPMAPGDLIELRVPAELVEAAEAEEQPARPSLDDLDPGPTITELR